MDAKKLLISIAIGSLILLSNSRCALAGTGSAESLFAMALRLEKSEPWKVAEMDKIESITGRTFHTNGIAAYSSDEKPDDKLLRAVQVQTDPSSGTVSGISLELPRQGLGISRAQVFAKFGKCSYEKAETNLGNIKREGFSKSIGYAYKRKNGGYLVFNFDNDKTKQLRILEVIH